MTPELLVTALKQWLKQKGFKIVNTDKPKEVVFEDTGGETHRIFFSDLDEKHGAVATNSRFAGALMQKFAQETMGEKATMMRTDMKIGDDKGGNPEDLLREAMEGGPDSVKKMLKEKGAEFAEDDPIKAIEKSYNALKQAALAMGDKDKLEELKRLGKLLDIARLVNSMKEELGDDIDLTSNEREFKRLKAAGKTLEPTAMKNIKVGDKFFDKHTNLNIAVGFEVGHVDGEFVNCVIVQPNERDKDNFSGLPVKRDLDEIVIPVKFP